MGLRDDIVNDVTQAFNTDLADAVVPVTVTNYKRGQYNPTTGKVDGEVVSQQQTRGVYLGFWNYEVYNSPVEPSDEKFLLLQDEISFEPEIATTIESEFRGLMRVIEVRKDPVNATYELRLRY